APILAAVGKTERGDLKNMFEFYDRVTARPEAGDRLEVARDYATTASAVENIAAAGGGADANAKNAIDKFMDWVSGTMASMMARAAAMMTDPNVDPVGALSSFGHL